MPRLKYDRDALRTMVSQVSKSRAEQSAKEERKEAEPSGILKQISQHCIRCGKVTVFSIDQLGYATCNKCRGVAPDRHSMAV